MSFKYDWIKYKDGLHLLSLNEDEKKELIEIIECNCDMAMELDVEELLRRRMKLQDLFKEYGEMLKQECYELFYMIGNMESNYGYICRVKRERGEVK